MEEALFVGIDLAWGERNRSGVAMLRWNGDALHEVTPALLLQTDEEIASQVWRYAEESSVIIAIDAPLIVPNSTGERLVEKEMRRRFARHHAACHPANRRLLGDPPRGERLCKLLAQQIGIRIVSAPPFRQPCRVAFEVYPHAALVTLFQLPYVLKYKARRGRALCYRCEQMDRYLHYLQQVREPPLRLPDWAREVPSAAGALKLFEDRVDALFCAWLAARAWWWGGEVVGDVSTGSIWLPTQEAP